MAAQLAAPHEAWGDELADLVRSVSVTDFTVTDSGSDLDDLADCLDLIVVAKRC